MKTRAAVLNETGRPRPFAKSRPIAIEEVDLAPPGPGEVLVEMAAAGLCHSDLSVITGDVPLPTPLVLGHEAAGIVKELGAGVDDLAVGDHVVMVFVASCGRCGYCAEGRPALCDPGRRANMKGTLLTGATRLSRAGAPLNHNMGVSCFADRAVVARGSLVRIDKAIPLNEAALFGCAIVTGVGAVVNTARVPAGATVAVVGLGGVGLATLLAALLVGAREVIAIDLRDDKLALARQLGATATHNAADKDLVRTIVRATGGGVEFAFDAAGAPAALELAFAITRTGGTTLSSGIAARDARVSLPAAVLTLGERTIKGSFMGSAVPSRDIPRFIELYRTGRLPIDRLLSDSIRLEDLNEGFDRLAEGSVVRQMVRFG
jgi:alcohol dehydrogenase